MFFCSQKNQNLWGGFRTRRKSSSVRNQMLRNSPSAQTVLASRLLSYKLFSVLADTPDPESLPLVLTNNYSYAIMYAYR